MKHYKLSLILLLVANLSYGSGFRLTNQDSLATARGGAYVATAEGPAAVYYNPAGLTQLEGSAVQAGVFAVDFDVSVQTDGASFSNSNPWQFIPHLYYAQSTDDYSFGVGVYSPYGLANKWGDNTSFRTITTEAEVTYITVSPVIAKSFGENLSLGAGLTINYAEADLRLGFTSNGNDEFQFKGDDIDVGFVLSGFWNPAPKHYFGAIYRSHVDHSLEGDSKGSEELAAFEQIGLFLVDTETTRTDMDIPDYAVVGYSYRPTPQWNIEFDLEWVNWDRFNTFILDSESRSLPFAFEWESTFIYEIGASYYWKDYVFSAGYDYNENAQPDKTYNPAVSDADRHWFNVGVGRKVDNFSWHVTYQYGYSNRTVSNSDPNPLSGETANGRYESRIHGFILSADYRF